MFANYEENFIMALSEILFTHIFFILFKQSRTNVDYYVKNSL